MKFKLTIIKGILQQMQQIDKNGTYDELYDELVNNEITIIEVKNIITEILQRWQEDSNDDKQLQYLLYIANTIN